MDSQDEDGTTITNTTNTDTTNSNETPSSDCSETPSLSSCGTSDDTDTHIVEVSETSSITLKSLSSARTEITTTTQTSESRLTSESKQARRAKSSHNLARYQRHILKLTNAIRAQHGVRALVLNADLNEAARLHNADIALVIKDLSHVSSDGRTLTERLLEQGYDFRYASENLARGQRDCRWVMKSWMKSAGHRRNIVSERVREMGLHVGVGEGKMYWTQVFGIRRGDV